MNHTPNQRRHWGLILSALALVAIGAYLIRDHLNAPGSGTGDSNLNRQSETNSNRQDRVARKATETRPREDTEEKIARMIEQLVSSNPPTTGEWDEEPPPPWTNEENWRVQELAQAIRKYEEAAVPALIDNLDRQEYAMSISTAVPYRPRSVGDVCRSSIESMFDPIGMMYKSRRNTKDESMMGSSYLSQLLTKEDFEEWWIQNRGKSVAEIQREARDWHVARESAFGFTDAQHQKNILDQIEYRYTGIPQKPSTTTQDSETDADADPFADPGCFP
jgi:hypothetical protein